MVIHTPFTNYAESKQNIECCTKKEIKATVSPSITVWLYSLQPHMKGDINFHPPLVIHI